MVKEVGAEKNKEPAVFEDSIIAGILHARGHTVIPYVNPDGKVIFKISGDVEKSLQEIYANRPIGSLDVVRSIKLTRSMIFNLRTKGMG